MAQTATLLSRWLPRLSTVALVVCIGSGLLLAFHYKFWGDAFASVEAITATVPYGFFFRRLHWVSGQVFAILVLAHAADHFFRRSYQRFGFAAWAKLWAATAVALGLLFTGFVLTADQEALFAARILEELLQRVPLVGVYLARLFMDRSDVFFLPWLHHCLLLTPLMAWLLADHVRRWLPDGRELLLAGAPLAAWALTVPLAPAVPVQAQVAHVKGPWFFLGLQELLLHLDPLWAGVLLPGGAAAVFLGLPLYGPRTRRAAHWGLVAALAVYGVLTVRMALRGAV